MSNGNDLDRLWKLQTKVNMMVLDGARDAGEIADLLQRYVIDLPKAEPVEKFKLLVDLGILTVPDDYSHATWLTTYKSRHQGGKKRSFYDYNNDITDENFGNPSRILMPGDKLHVRAFRQVVGGTTTSKERMAFLKGQSGNVFTGAQGASLVFNQKRDQLPKGKWYASFDEPDRLCKGGVPGVLARTDGNFGFHLSGFAPDWDEVSALLCFTEVSEVCVSSGHYGPAGRFGHL